MNQQPKPTPEQIQEQINSIANGMLAPLEQTAGQLEKLINQIVPMLPDEAQEELRKQVKNINSPDVRAAFQKKLDAAMAASKVGDLFARALEKAKSQVGGLNIDQELEELRDAARRVQTDKQAQEK